MEIFWEGEVALEGWHAVCVAFFVHLMAPWQQEKWITPELCSLCTQRNNNNHNNSLFLLCVSAGTKHEKRRFLGLWREGFWCCGRRKVAKLSLAWSTPCVYMGWGWKAGESMARASSLKTGIVTPPHQGPGLRAFQKPPLGALLGLPKETLQLWRRKSEGKKNSLKVNWITATESLRECLMGPLINDSGSQWDIAFGLMPCTAAEAPCNEHTKRAPSSLGALAQNTPEFNICWMAKWCLQ